MEQQPLFPAAVIGDDGVARIAKSLAAISRSVEPPEVTSTLVIDFSGRTFAVEVEGDRNLFERLLSVIGTPHRYRLVETQNMLSTETMNRVLRVLQASFEDDQPPR